MRGWICVKDTQHSIQITAEAIRAAVLLSAGTESLAYHVWNGRATLWHTKLDNCRS